MSDIVERLDQLVEDLGEGRACYGVDYIDAAVDAAAEITRLRAKLRITKGALGDIADGEPEWPDDPAKELEWCRNRALAAYREADT
jgi:hypothetical protein